VKFPPASWPGDRASCLYSTVNVTRRWDVPRLWLTTSGLTIEGEEAEDALRQQEPLGLLRPPGSDVAARRTPERVKYERLRLSTSTRVIAQMRWSPVHHS
jgi:hypothetical protein